MPAPCSEECGGWLQHHYIQVGVCLQAARAQATYGPQETRRERTLSIPMSHTFIHSPLISMQRPWKFSWSYTHIWTVGSKVKSVRVKKGVSELKHLRRVETASGDCGELNNGEVNWSVDSFLHRPNMVISSVRFSSRPPPH